MKKEIVYVLKRCKTENKAYNDFIYPKKGTVEAPDWKDTTECGNGLHGWTLGFEDYTDGNLHGNFIVLEVNKKDGYVELVDKVKFKKGKVVLNTPNAEEAHAFMLAKYPTMKLHWATQSAGDYSTQTAGSSSVMIQRYVSDRTSIIKFAENSVAILFTDDGVPHVYTKYKNETVYFYDGKPKKVYKHTDNNIKKLAEHEIFVFGSNLNGNHAGGSARLAEEKFGAEAGIGEGLTGQSYAFPTLNKDMQKCTFDELNASVEKLIKCATENTTKIFLVTKVGTGIAGFTEEEMKSVFSKNLPANIVLPKGW